MRIFPATLLVHLCACFGSIEDAKLERLAMRAVNLADVCLVDVRDQDIPYDQSTACKTIGDAYVEYSMAGGTIMRPAGEDGPVPRHVYMAEVARERTWGALAISNAKHPRRASIRVW